MPAVSVAMIDVLNGLVGAEQASMIRFMGEGSPYLSRATAEVRRPLAGMVEASNRHIGALYELIEDLGGEVTRRGQGNPEEQYLAYLSLKFLLPRLVDDKLLLIRYYENALRAIGKQATDGVPARVTELLEQHLAEHRRHLEELQKAAEAVIAAARAGAT